MTPLAMYVSPPICNFILNFVSRYFILVSICPEDFNPVIVASAPGPGLKFNEVKREK